MTSQSGDLFAELSLEKCYQCGKCTAGCPLAGQMDLMPNQVLRLVRAGDLDKVLHSQAIWLCVACFTCTARCPQSVDGAALMDTLRQMAAERGLCSPEQRRILLFQQAFLDNVRRNGRVKEVELIAQFKMQGFLKDRSVPLLLKDSMLGPKMMQRGKLHLGGHKLKDKAVVRRIFERCRRIGAASSPAQGGSHP